MIAGNRIVRTTGWAALVWLALSGTVAAQVAIPGWASEAGSRVPALPDTMETARTMAMGLGARASATSTSAVAVNPAGMSIGRLYHIGTAVTYDPQPGRFSTGASLMDSYSGPINMGTNFRYIFATGDTGHAGMDGRIALGLPLGEMFAIGLTGRYMSFTRQGQTEDEELAPFAEQITMDAAIRITPMPGLHFAVLGYNLIDVGSPLVPLQVGGSVSYTFENTFTLAFDGLADLSTWHDAEGNIIPQGLFGGAAELFTGEVPIRAGYMFDTGRNVHYVTAGLGWRNEELGIDIGYRQQVTGPDLATNLLASLQYFVQ